MKNVIILIAGMGGTGKTSFAKYLSTKLNIPLVCYDTIKAKEWDIIQKDEQLSANNSFGRFSYEYFWFFIDEIMKSGSPLIAEYFFHPKDILTLNELVENHNYKAITVILDADIEIAYDRFIRRNKSKDREEGLRVIMDFENFKKCSKPNKLFRFGKNNIVVDVNDFNVVSYEDIIEKILYLINSTFPPVKVD